MKISPRYKTALTWTFAILYPNLAALAAFKFYDLGPLGIWFALLVVQKPAAQWLLLMVFSCFFIPPLVALYFWLDEQQRPAKMAAMCILYPLAMAPLVLAIDGWIGCNFIGPCEAP